MTLLPQHTDIRLVASSGLAFFSQRKIDSLTKRLGNPRLRQLVDSVEDLVRSRLSDQVKADPWRSRYRALEPVHISKDETQDFIQREFNPPREMISAKH